MFSKIRGKFTIFFCGSLEDKCGDGCNGSIHPPNKNKIKETEIDKLRQVITEMKGH